MAIVTRPACPATEIVAKGRESAAVLQALLGQQPVIGASTTAQGLQDLIEQILCCCDRALAALRSGTEDPAAGGARKRKPERGPDAPRPTSSKKTRVSGAESGIRVEKKPTMEDSFIWRKYGQKEIRDSKYPRLYFRCTYSDHGCMAKRQVQQTEADPSVYHITYFGEHTCRRDDDDPPAPFVINFGSSRTKDEQRSGSPWPSCDDNGLVVSETSEICSLSEGEDLPADMGNVAELMEHSTPGPVPEPAGMSFSSQGWEPLEGCLDWVLCDDESSFDIGQSINYDYFGLLQ